MKQCFCGCGEKVGFRLRVVNRRAAAIDGQVEMLVLLMRAGMSSENAEAFIDEGRDFCTAVRELLHTRGTAGARTGERARELEVRARAEFGPAAFARASVDRGLSTAEAIHSLRRGAFDPFAGTIQAHRGSVTAGGRP